MIRVLQAIAGAEHGGAETFFMRLVSALHRAGLHQHVLLRPVGGRPEALRALGLSPVEAPFGGPFDFRTSRQFGKILEAFQPHVVMTWMNRATKFCPPGPHVQVARLGGYYDLKYYQGCDHLVGNTADIRRWIVAQGWPEERAHYVPNFAPKLVGAALPRKPHYTPDNAPLILAMGRLHENKAFDTLLDALVRVPGAYLWLAGEGPERTTLEAHAERVGVKPRVRFLGWRDDVAALMATADVFVCPSRHEPLGNVILEAWSCGRPVVATEAAGPQALIKHEETGLLVPIDRPKDLAEAIKAVLHYPDGAVAMAEAGHQAFLASHSEEAVVAAYLSFFEAVAKTGKVA